MTPTIAPNDALVEKVARAICDEAEPTALAYLPKDAADAYREQARAAIEASGITTLLERERRAIEALTVAEVTLRLDGIRMTERGMATAQNNEAQRVVRAALTQPNPDREV